MDHSAGSPGAEQCLAWRDGDVLRLDGEIDQTNAEPLMAGMIADVRFGVLEFDLSAVRFIGAAGVRVLLSVRAEAIQRGVVLRVACSPVVRRVLEICGVADHHAWSLTGPNEAGRADRTAGEP